MYYGMACRWDMAIARDLAEMHELTHHGYPEAGPRRVLSSEHLTERTSVHIASLHLACTYFLFLILDHCQR